MTGNLISTLNKIPLFNGLDDNELKVILSLCKAIKTNTNECLFKEGDPSHHLYILLAGEIDLSTHKSGHIYTLTQRDIFGEIGLITQRTRSASAHCKSECSLLSIHHVEFNFLSGKHPHLFSILMKNISTNLANHVVRMNGNPLDHIPGSTKRTPNTPPSQVLSNSPK